MTGSRVRADAIPAILFGGPDRPVRYLRDQLHALVEAAPGGSRIDWATYYFRDLDLAAALTRAVDRGVAVRLVLEAEPRQRGANRAAIALLGRHGLGGGLHLRRRFAGLGQLHAKIYAFSDPQLALVGSFNPSGNRPEGPAVIAEIGDQDRGYNLLLGIADPALVAGLRAQVAFLGAGHAGPLDRLRPRLNTVIGDGATRVFLYPRLRTRLVEAEVARLGAGCVVEAALSHLKPGTMIEALTRAGRRGAAVTVLVHATERRVPDRAVALLRAEGVETVRVGDAAAVPMHNKFVVVRGDGPDHAWVGSYNFNAKSRWLNDEVLVRTEAPDVVEALAARFMEMRG